MQVYKFLRMTPVSHSFPLKFRQKRIKDIIKIQYSYVSLMFMLPVQEKHERNDNGIQFKYMVKPTLLKVSVIERR